MPRDTFIDVAAILHPLPEPPAHTHVDDVEGYDALRDEIVAERGHTLEQMRLGWDEGEIDPVLGAIASARRVQERAEADIRRLFAYAREFVAPRPYTLTDLADAAGMSISGVRTGYDHHDVDEVAEVTGAKWRAPEDAADETAVVELISAMARRHRDPERPQQIAAVLREEGWTAYAPTARAPGTKATRRYVRWVRTWPNDTTAALYQESTFVASSGKIPDGNQRRFHVDYAGQDLQYFADQLDAFTRRMDQIDATRAGIVTSS
jgi:hypothetical protein